MARVVIEQLSKIFPGAKGEEIHAVRKANLTVQDKEFLVLVGPSGCGKTTLLRMLAGLEEVSEGLVRIDDKIVNEVPPQDRDIAMVFQNYALYPHMTVFENLAFGLKLRGVPKPEITIRVRETSETLGLTGLLDRKPKALSSGQRQRVAVGRAIVRKPALFLFDEPLSNLDAPLRAQMRLEITQLHRTLQTTMIYVTHDQVEAMTMGERVAVMCDGLIQQVDAPMCLYHSPVNRFVAGFIGSPPMNFFQGAIFQKGTQIFFREQSGRGEGGLEAFTVHVDEAHGARLGPFSGKSLILGLRPENIHTGAANLSARLGAVSGCDESTPESDALKRVMGKVEAVEALGSESHLHLRTAAHAFLARITPQEEGKLNQVVSLRFDMAKAHFFDPETGMAVGAL